MRIRAGLIFVIIAIPLLASAVTVTVSTPANNATVTSPATINAKASSNRTITGWHIYLDGVSVYSAGATTSISAAINMKAGSHQVIVRAWNSAGSYGSALLTETVAASTPAPPSPPSVPTPLAITSSGLPGATAGAAYSMTLTATGGTSPYTWSVVSGQLPSGVSLSGSGALAGTPSVTGTSSFTLQAKDSAASPQAATKSESITVAAAATSGQPPPPPQASGYSLAFSDDFNSLNISPNGTGNYTWFNGIWWESPVSPLTDTTTANSILNLNWMSGQGTTDTSITTAAKNGSVYKAWTYGYFEASLKWQNKTQGAWPAFWMIPVEDITGADVSNGVRDSGEIDIMEGQGGAYPNTIYGTIHEWKNNSDVYNNNNSNAYNVSSSVDLSQYHTYGVLWTPGTISWYFDNQLIHSASTTAIFDKQHFYLVLGSQVGANWSAGSGVSASTVGMQVDWVRVWQP